MPGRQGRQGTHLAVLTAFQSRSNLGNRNLGTSGKSIPLHRAFRQPALVDRGVEAQGQRQSNVAEHLRSELCHHPRWL
jgi:hypothetical protein